MMGAALGLPPAVDHDAAPGPLTRCQVSGSQHLFEAIDLGAQPLCDALVSDLRQPETVYPLRLMICPESGLGQLDYVVPGTTVYPAEYPYRAGISWPLQQYQRAFADAVVGRFHGLAGAFVVDVGSNDGALLTGFQRHGCRVLGVEPTNVARVAIEESGVPTLQAFFGEQAARWIVAEHGRAQLVTMTNVFAHMADLGNVMRGLDVLLSRTGVCITESHYLLDVLERDQFDTVYHEHIRTYSLRSLVTLAGQYGLEVFDVERGSRYGGNIRAYIARRGQQPVANRVGELLRHEAARGLFSADAWRAWRERVRLNRDRFMDWLYAAHRSGKRVVGVSSPGRAQTMINWYGIGPDLVAYLGEVPGSLKIGKYSPGRRLPIVPNTRIPAEQPDAAILFAWHYAAEIVARLKREGVRAELVQPLPSFQILPA